MEHSHAISVLKLNILIKPSEMAEIPKKDSDNAKRTPIVWENGRYRKVDLGKVPFGAWLLTRIGLFNFSPEYR